MSDTTSVPSRQGSPAPSALPDLPTARPYRFTWDPASRRPGPESVSGTTEGRGDYFGHAPALGFLNTSSNATLALGALPSEWSSAKHGFHGTFLFYCPISTVLNNPHKKQAPPKAHSSLPAVTPADLPRVRRKDFDSYLRAISPEWQRFEHNAKLGREGQAQIQRMMDEETNTVTPRASMASDAPPLTAALKKTLLIRTGEIPPLESVPSVFFQKDFNLGDARTFGKVTEQEGVSPFDDDPLSNTYALSIPLLEKYSHYADTVEQHLVREISIRSHSFFAALTNLQDLQSESEHCLDRISRLRMLLKEVDDKQAKKGLEAVRKEVKLTNVEKVKEGVKLITGVVEMTGVARGLVNAGQWGEALGMVEEIEKLWDLETANEDDLRTPRPILRPEKRNGRLSPLPPTPEEEENSTVGEVPPPPPPKTPERSQIPLSSLHAFSALPSHLRALTMEIAASLSSELVAVLRSDLEMRISGTTVGANIESLKDRLTPLLQGLVRTKGVKEGVLSWREIVLGEIRSVVKRRLPAFEVEDGRRDANAVDGRSGLANHLRSLAQSEFMTLIQDIYRNFFNAIQGLQLQSEVITQVLESIKFGTRHSSASSRTEVPAIEDELFDILSSAIDLANTQAAKVISYRTEQHAALELAEFLAFFNDSWAFVVKCEVICRRMVISLRGTILNQARSFLQAFHQARISRSAKLVEDEQWNPAEVTPSLQHIADILIASAVRDSPELVIKPEETIFSPPASASLVANSLSPKGTPGTPVLSPQSPPSLTAALAQAANVNETGTASKYLRIEDRTFFVVSATTEVLVLLLDYLRFIVNLPLLTTDSTSRVIEFLKAFNSRTCQVVLGAGAMRSAGLKNITAKHLAPQREDRNTADGLSFYFSVAKFTHSACFPIFNHVLILYPKALASQSLSVIFELIPYVRETFRRHLSQTEAVMLVEFDKLKRDFQEHQNEIHAKLIAIMGDRLNAHIRSLQVVDWNVPKVNGGVNDYMEILVKETVTLHKVLSRYLSGPVVEYVMTQVFAAINHRLSEEYTKIELPNQEAKTRLLADARYLHQKLAALRSVGAASGMLETVVAEKGIPRTSNVPSPLPTPTRSSTISVVSSSANQRLKGLLSKSSVLEKALPTPTRSPTPPVSSAPPIPPEKSKSPAPSFVSSINGSGLGTEASMSGSTLALATPPIEESVSANRGFKQVEETLAKSGEETQLVRSESPAQDPSNHSSRPLPFPSETEEKEAAQDASG
ncbi:Vps54-like protein-domain-containing protein [Cyathus striatus]|nr:Vps54-like protein-domain-containing protein [Cyathus striatus]